MTCPEPLTNTFHQSPKEFENWNRRLNFEAQDAYRPTTRGEIVQIILDAEQNNRSVKWIGSLWSFLGNFVSEDVVVETESISGDISPDIYLANLPLSPPNSIDQFVHIRGGTKIYNVNRILHGLGAAQNGGMPDEINLDLSPESRAMPTLGGSGGQSIAGLISTGSHGGDVHLPPMADAVAAIHLIGPGGREYWLEKFSNPLTARDENSLTDELRRSAKIAKEDPNIPDDMCTDITAIRDDDLFNSVLVSIGRMGFIYSLVLRVEDGFKLEENTMDETWESYDDNLSSQQFESFLEERAAQLGNQLHFLQILINPFRQIDGTHQCKVTERIVVEPSSENIGMEAGDGGNALLNFFCQRQNVSFFLPILIGMEAALVGSFMGLIALASAIAVIPIVGWIIAGAIYASAAALVPVILAVGALILTLTFSPQMTTGDLLALVSNFAFRFGLGRLIRQLLTSLFNSRFPVGEQGRKIGVGWKLMDTYNYEGEDFCQKVESVEFAFNVFDTSDGGYRRFIRDVLNLFGELINRNMAIAGVLALRYTRKTSAKLGMSRFYITCHVEIPILPGLVGNTEFRNRVRQRAVQLGGVASWGQGMDLYTSTDVSNIFGSDLLEWRQSLRTLIDLGQANDSTFSNDLTVRLNLEPL